MWILFLLLTIAAGAGAITFLVLTIKKRRRAWIGLVASIIIGAFTSIAFLVSIVMTIPASDESAVASKEVEEEVEKDEGELGKPEDKKNFEINEKYDLDGFIFEIKGIKITEKYVIVNVKAENNREGTVSFYPNQGEIIVGNKQLSSNFLMNKGDGWGDIHSGVVKSGEFKYVADDDGIVLEDISEIKLMYGNIYDDDIGSQTFEEIIKLD